MKLTDAQAHDQLSKAAELLASCEGETVRAETALRAAERVLYLLQFGLVKAMEDATQQPPLPGQPLD